MTGSATGGRGGFPWRTAAWSAAGLILLAPLVAMQFTRAVDWDLFDFLFMGGLMGAVGLGLELAFRASRAAAFRCAAALGLAAGFLLVWLTGAVGLIGNEGLAANRLYAGVLVIALGGAVLARFLAGGLAWAMAAAALAQGLVPLLAWVIWPEARPVIAEREVPVLTLGFSGLWLAAAALFGRARREVEVELGSGQG